jgi:hypothetical protein
MSSAARQYLFVDRTFPATYRLREELRGCLLFRVWRGLPDGHLCMVSIKNANSKPVGDLAFRTEIKRGGETSGCPSMQASVENPYR